MLKKLKKKPGASSSKGKGKRGVKTLLLGKLRVRTTSILNNLNFHLKRKEVQKMKTITLRG